MRRTVTGLLALACAGLSACSNLQWPGDTDMAQATTPGQTLPFRAVRHSRAHDPVLHDMVVAAAFSPDNKYVAIGSAHAYDIVIWDVENRRTVRHLPMPGGIDRDALVWSPDGRYLVSFLGQTVYVFDPYSGATLQQLALEKGRGGVDSIRINHNGSRLLVCYHLRDDADYNLAIFDTANWSKKTFNTQQSLYVSHAFWAQEQIVLIGHDMSDENFVSKLDPDSGAVTGRLKLTEANPSELLLNRRVKLDATNVDRSGKTMAVAFQDLREIPYSTVQVVDIEALTLRKTIKLPPHIYSESLAFLPNGFRAFSRKIKGSIDVIDLERGEIVGNIPHDVSSGGLAISQDGKFLSIGRFDDLQIYRLDLLPGNH